MTQAIPISAKPIDHSAVALGVVGLILVVVGLVLGDASAELATASVLFGVLFLVLAGRLSRSARRAKRSIEIYPDGFLIRPGDRFVPDAAVARMQVQWFDEYRKSQPQAQRLEASLTIRGEAGGEELPIYFRLPLGDPDPFHELFTRLFRRRCEATRALVESGREWAGDGWALSAKGVRVGEEVVPFDEIVLADVFNGHVCLWRRGEEEPFLEVPDDEPDAMVFREVVGEMVARGESAGDPSSIGLRCFHRNLTYPRAKWLGLVVVSLAGVVAGPLMVVGGVWGVHVHLITGGVSVAFGGLMGLRLARNRRLLELHVHQNGIRIVKPKGDDAVRFDEVAAMSWSHVAKGNPDSEGRPCGEWRLKLEPADPAETPPLDIWASFPLADADLLKLREMLAREIGKRMWRTLIENGEVAWSDLVWIRPGELLVNEARWGGTDGWREVPYTSITHEGWVANSFQLHTDGRKVALDSTAENFYPGLALMRYLWALAMNPSKKVAGSGPFDAAANPTRSRPYVGG